jgi:NNMT/PNMT/TEMT family
LKTEPTQSNLQSELLQSESPLNYTHDTGAVAKAYLEDNYDRVDDENAFLLEFFHDIYSKLPEIKRLVEIGGGASLYMLISARRVVEKIVYAEPGDWCRAEIEAWREGSPKAHNWAVFFEYVRQLEGMESTLGAMQAQLRSKISEIIPCDVYAGDCGLGIGGPAEFDVVSSNFCAESITSDIKKFELSIKNIASLVAPKGHLVLSMLEDGRFWTLGDSDMPCITVDDRYVFELLQNASFEKNGQFGETKEAARGDNYSGILCLVARRV